MRFFAVPLLAVVLSVAASGLERYTVPGVETDEVLMSVHVWGEVRSPGTYLVPVESDLVAGISAAGGPTSVARLSDVRIVYGDREVKYDLEDFLEGRGEQVPRLQPGATIYLNTRGFEWWKEAIDFSYKIIVAVNLIWIMSER
ncbi:MAG: SLBB domain-containing protein [Candidatus Aegiribacteria sp.]